MKRLVKNTIVQTMGKALTVLVGIITTKIFTNYLSVDEYGKLTIFTSVFLIFDSLADMGSKLIGVREISSEGKDSKSVGWLRLATLGLGFMAGIVFVVNDKFFLSNFKISGLALMMVVLTWEVGNIEMIFQIISRLDIKTVIDIMFTCLSVVFLWISKKNLSVYKIYLVYIWARISSLIVAEVILMKRRKIVDTNEKFVKSSFVKLVKESFPMGLYLLIFTAYDRAIDSLVIKKYLGEMQVGIYGLAYKIYLNLVMPAYFFCSNIFPTLSKKNESKNDFYKKSLKIISMAGVAMAVFTIFASKFMINVLASEQFIDSVLIIRILAVGLVFSYINHMFGFYLISEGGQKKMLKFGVISLVFNLMMNIIFVPKFGIVAAAVITVLTEGLMSVMYARNSR